VPVKWKKVWISDETFESAAVFDVNNDGILDIVSGAYWYEGPDFKKKHQICTVKSFGEYYDDFSTIPLDVNGDGYKDYITGGWWGRILRWMENPCGDPSKQWQEHIIAEVGNIETTRAWDIDGDGNIEIIPNTPGERKVRIFKLNKRSGDEKSIFKELVIFEFPEGQRQGHGLGCGDIAGKGCMDIVLSKGWLEAPRNPYDEEWLWHPEFDFGMASVPILVVDLNEDGKNEIIVGNAHGYGLAWWEKDLKTKKWVYHPIDPYNAQYHDMQWIDIDGDNKPELVTGKRHRAHCGNEEGEWDDVGIYYFKWTGESFSKQIIDYGPIGIGKGCGIHFAVADLRKTGRMDLIAPGKDGLYVYFNEGI